MEHIDNVKILYQVIDIISTLDIKGQLDQIDAVVGKLTQADSTGIYTLDKDTHSVVLRASKLHFNVIDHLKMKVGEGITGWVVESGATVAIEKDAQHDPRFSRVTSLPDDLFEAFLSVPIKSSSVVIGVINVKYKEAHTFEPKVVKLIEAIGQLVGQSIEHSMLLEESKNLKEALETQKLLNRAKGILMERHKLSENDSYHFIRKQAMRENKSIKHVAEAIITYDALIK